MPAVKPSDIKDMPDGQVMLDGQCIDNNDFSDESEMRDYLYVNAARFFDQWFSDVPVILRREHQLEGNLSYYGPRGRRIDIYAKGREREYIIEMKKPKFLSENRKAIGQLLDYGREFLDPKKVLILMTTKFDVNTALTIQSYKLPIRYFWMSRDQTMEYVGVS